MGIAPAVAFVDLRVEHGDVVDAFELHALELRSEEGRKERRRARHEVPLERGGERERIERPTGLEADADARLFVQIGTKIEV